MSISRSVCALVLGLALLVPASASAATISELQAQIQALLAQIASLQGDNPTSEVVPGSIQNGPYVEVVSPNGGETYEAGSNKSLTISWKARKMPSGSTVCVTLVPTDENGSFLWGNDGCIKAKNGLQKITSKLIRNSGYDLGPGSYIVRVVVNPKPDGSGKDLAPVAQDDSDGVITLTSNDEPAPVCTLQTTQRRTPIIAGDAVTITWASSNADYAKGPGGDKLPANGRETYYPEVTKTYTYKFYGPGGTTICEKRVEVDDAGTDPTSPTTDTTGSTGSDTMNVSPRTGSKPLVVSFSGTVNGKKSCGGGTYSISFGDGATHTISVPADVCRVQTFSTTHTYSKDGTYTAGLYRGLLSKGDLITRTSIQVSTPEQSSGQSVTPTGDTSAPSDCTFGTNALRTRNACDLLNSASAYAAMQAALDAMKKQLEAFLAR